MQVNHNKNIIEVNDVSFDYTGETVLENINLKVHEGDYLGIVGPNGGGKTTLIKLMLGLLKPSKGVIKINVPTIGYVSQNSTNFDNNFPITAREVVAQGRLAGQGLLYRMKKNDWEMVDKALQTVDIYNLKDKLIGELSGGQKQRVFIARAIAGNHPHIIFLDEPTTGIDVESQRHFYAFLKKLNETLGMTLILVSHEIDVVAKEANHVAFVNHTLVYYNDPKILIKEHYKVESHSHD